MSPTKKGDEIKGNHRRSLPPEIISRILIGLPAKSVMRFSCVSKTWFSIIKDPYFVKSHHARSYTRPSGIKLIACREVHRSYNFFYTDPEGNSPLEFLTMPPVLSGSVLTRLHSVHGLICASNCIWNPTTNESIVLPSLSIPTFVDGNSFKNRYEPEYYLGFDSSINTHKVLSILYSTRYDGVNTYRSTEVFKIFDLGGSSWRDVKSFPSKLEVLDRHFFIDHSCSIDNLICFGHYKSILAFDVRCEKFEMIPAPDDLTYPCELIHVGQYISLINMEIETIWILEDYKKHQWRSERLEIGSLLKGIKSKVKSDKKIEITLLGTIHTGEILLQIRSDKMLYYFYYDIDRKVGRMVPKLVGRMKGIHPNLSVNNTSLKIHVESIYQFK